VQTLASNSGHRAAEPNYAGSCRYKWGRVIHCWLSGKPSAADFNTYFVANLAIEPQIPGD
jgi:hypothetical protein